MSQQATKKRRRSAKQPTLRQFVEGGLDQSKIAGLDFFELVEEVFTWIRRTLLSVRGDSEYQCELIPTLCDLSIAMVVLRKASRQKMSTWPQSSGIAFGTWVSTSALQLIENLGDDLQAVCFEECQAIWKPGVTGLGQEIGYVVVDITSPPPPGAGRPKPGVSGPKIVNGIVVYDHIDWDAKVTEKLLFTWRKQALTKIAEMLPSAEEFPTFQLQRDWDLVEVAFMDEERRSKSSPDADSGSAAEGETLPPLSDHAADVYELLLKLPPHRGLIGRKLLAALSARDVFVDQSTLTKRIIPALKPYGVENKPKIGYFIAASKRPKETHDAPQIRH